MLRVDDWFIDSTVVSAVVSVVGCGLCFFSLRVPLKEPYENTECINRVLGLRALSSNCLCDDNFVWRSTADDGESVFIEVECCGDRDGLLRLGRLSASLSQ